MREFFVDEIIDVPYVFLDWQHIICLSLLLIIFTIIVLNKNKISNLTLKIKDKVSFICILVMFINMVLYYGSKVVYGTFNWKVDLPFHLCFISNFLFMYTVIKKNDKLYKWVYFLAFIGPLPAILWPDNPSGYNSFNYYHQFFSHHFYLLSNMFVLYAYNWKIAKKDMLLAYLYTSLIFWFFVLFNYIFGTNYIMSSNLPPHILKIYPWVKHINYPIVILEIVGILGILVCYIPIYFINKKKL